MMMLPCAFWPLAEHISFGQNCFDASIGSVSVCICYSMPMDACFFKHSFPFHRLVEFYPGIFRPWSGTSHNDSDVFEYSAQNSSTGVDSVEHSGQLPDCLHILVVIWLNVRRI